MNRHFPVQGSEAAEQQGPFRLLSHQGRLGLQGQSVQSRLVLPVDINRMPAGTLTQWILPVEELSYRYSCGDSRGAHPGVDANNHILIGDHPDHENVHDSAFALIWDCGWYPQYWVKFFKKYLYHSGFQPTPKLLAAAGHMSFERLRWVQVAVTWDKPSSYAAIYVNGICISESPDNEGPLEADPCGTQLYAGSTAFAVGDITVLDRKLEHAGLWEQFEKENTQPDPAYQQKLKDMYYGENPGGLSFQPDAEWSRELTLSLKEPDHLKAFYVQGMKDSPSITPEGLEIHTSEEMPDMKKQEEDRCQMYLWSEQSFEGDLYLTYEYMPLKEGGLSLLLTQASGLQGEDFLNEYPRRTTGSMSMVCWENVRNYHWEYYREVSDVPPGSATSGLIKNPWITPLAYRRVLEPTEKNVWHRLEFLQQGERIRGALDGVLQFDVLDSGSRGNGPVYRHGHFAIRCMLRSHLRFRNLEVWNRKPPFEILES